MEQHKLNFHLLSSYLAVWSLYLTPPLKAIPIPSWMPLLPCPLWPYRFTPWLTKYHRMVSNGKRGIRSYFCASFRVYVIAIEA